MTYYRQSRIKEVLREQGRSQIWLARQMGYTPKYISRMLFPIERRVGRPYNPEFVRRACAALLMPESALFFDPVPSTPVDDDGEEPDASAA